MLKRNYKLALLIAAITLVGCATERNSLYHWDQYQAVVYQYYQPDTPIQQQIDLLEQNISNAQENGKAIAPGVYAHLGLLYNNNAQLAQALQAFEKEKELFPEATNYMNFLLATKLGK